MKPASQANPALSKPSGQRSLRTLVWTWGIMAIVSLPMGWMICSAGGTPTRHALLATPVTCLAGPLSFLRQDLDALPVVGLYGLGVVWLLWKPSGWSKAVFILLSVLWLVLGCAVACIPF